MNPLSNRILNDIQDFYAYLSSAYGIIGSLSIFFPLSGQIFDLIPVPGPRPKLFTIIATVICVFTIFAAFVKNRREPELGWKFFFCGIVCFLLYLQLLPELEIHLNIKGWLAIKLLSTLNLVTYWAIFGFITHAFAILAVEKYNQHHDSKNRNYR